MARYPEISDHGLIGDLQTAALVSTDGVLDWFCCPRFDSPSVFGSLLDADRGGFFRIAPDRDDYVSRQLYLPDTAVLVTRFLTPDGVGEVHDFMPVAGAAVTDRHRLVRHIRVVRGVMRFKIEIQPRFDYGRAAHQLETSEHGAVFRSAGLKLTVHGIGPEGSSLSGMGIELVRDGGGGRWTRTLREGESGRVVLESMGDTPRIITPEQVRELQEDTQRFWRSWLARLSYRGRWREMVDRSAITLKLMTYAPTGAPVAAPTAGLPEQAGGERNWDYRYTWIRDGSFSIYALLGLGYTEEAASFGGWLRDRAQEQAGSLSRRSQGRRGHLLAVHVLVRRRAGPRRAAGRGPAGRREDAHLRQPPAPVLRGDQRHRRAARQLPAGLQPPVTDQRRHQPGPSARPRPGTI